MRFVHISVILILGISLFSCTTRSDTQETMAKQSLLSDSPRHHEWIELEREAGTFKAFVVYPESSEATDAVVVIHENRGLNDWARSFADELASRGFLVIAPDLISNTVEGYERTTDFPNSDVAREAIYALDPAQVTHDLNTTFTYIKDLPASTGKVSVVGFCWGGAQSFRYATNNPTLEKAIVFYGTAPEDKTVLKIINCPVYGFYGGDDNRVNATIDATKEAMDEYDQAYSYEIYEGAGHAFMRRGSQPEAEGPNKDAHDAAWAKLVTLLKA